MLLKMLVGVINFGRGYFSWTVNTPLTYHRNAPFPPEHAHSSTQSSSANCFPISTQQKNGSRNPKEMIKTWLFPTTLHKTHQWVCPPQEAQGALQTNRAHFKLINNNISLYSAPPRPQRASSNITKERQNEYSFLNSNGDKKKGKRRRKPKQR